MTSVDAPGSRLLTGVNVITSTLGSAVCPDTQRMMLFACKRQILCRQVAARHATHHIAHYDVLNSRRSLVGQGDLQRYHALRVQRRAPACRDARGYSTRVSTLTAPIPPQWRRHSVPAKGVLGLEALTGNVVEQRVRHVPHRRQRHGDHVVVGAGLSSARRRVQRQAQQIRRDGPDGRRSRQDRLRRRARVQVYIRCPMQNVQQAPLV